MLAKNTLRRATALKAPVVPRLAQAVRSMSTAAKGAAGSEAKIVTAPWNGEVKTAEGYVRPISPDLQIWQFSPTAYLHVGVRISGAILASGMTVTGLYGAFVGCDVPSAIYALKDAVPAAVPVLKAAVAMPLTYHFLGGVRQIYHDFTCKGIDAEFQDKSSIALAATTGVVTVVAALA